MQRNHLQLYTLFLSSTYYFYFYFITPFHLRFIVCSVVCVCVFFSSLVALVSIVLSRWDCSLFCIWSDVISVKTLPKFTHIHWMTFVLRTNSTQRNGKDSKLLHSAHFRQLSDEIWWALSRSLVSVHVFALNRPYYRHAKEMPVHFSCHFVYTIHSHSTVEFLCFFFFDLVVFIIMFAENSFCIGFMMIFEGFSLW